LEPQKNTGKGWGSRKHAKIDTINIGKP